MVKVGGVERPAFESNAFPGTFSVPNGLAAILSLSDERFGDVPPAKGDTLLEMLPAKLVLVIATSEYRSLGTFCRENEFWARV